MRYMKRGFQKLFFSLLAGLTLFLGAGTGHAFMPVSAMTDMGKQMSQNQCQSSCSSQSTASAPSQKVDIDEKDLEPQPAEPYYLAFMGVGWTVVITGLAVYLQRHLRWRPPDLFKLNVNYQF